MKYDVAVIGAGPAGSTAAKFLSEKGVKVLLIDKSTFPRDKPCGGGLPVRVLKRFKYVEEKDLIESYSYGICAHSSSLKYKVEVQRNQPLIAMVLRKKFDEGLVKLAIDSGAVFIDGKSAEDIKISEDKARIILNDGTNIESQIVIGADGIWSNIAKKSGLGQNRRNICMCIFQEYPMSTEVLDRFFSEKRFVHIHFSVQGIAGYGWVFPKKEHVNIGVTEFRQAIDPLKEKRNLKEVYNNYIKILKESKIIPDNLNTGSIRGAALPTHPIEKTYADRVILCGDAGGLVNPASGEGIYHAMSSGEIAADVTVEALEAGNTSGNFLSQYQTIWKKDFGKDIKLLFRVSKRWGKGTEKIFRLASKDKKLVEFALDVMTDRCSVHEYKWKIVRRFFYAYFKHLFKLG